MLHRRLRLLLRISYWHLLALGFMAAPLQSLDPRHGRTRTSVPPLYLLYSLACTSLLLLWLPFLFPRNIFDGYMQHNVVLQWTFLVGLTLRILTWLGIYGVVWFCRRPLLRLYVQLATLWRSHAAVQQRMAGSAALERLQLTLATLLGRQLCVGYAVQGFATYMVFHLVPATRSFWSLLVRFSLFSLLMVAQLGIYTLLLLLSYQFEAVRLALTGLHTLLQRQERLGDLYSSRFLVSDLRCMMALHSNLYRLARQFFRIYDLPSAMIWLNIFTNTVTTFYHAVQFVNSNIKGDSWDLAMGLGLVLSSFGSTVMLMNMLDRVRRSCNDTFEILRQFSDLEMPSRDFELELNRFAICARSHRLVFRICHCIEVDKPACLSYMGTVLLNVITLMQFDLKYGHKSKEGPSNFPYLPTHK